jgi:hypothetical protein
MGLAFLGLLEELNKNVSSVYLWSDLITVLLNCQKILLELDVSIF